MLGEFIGAARITSLQAEGFEADDLIGTAVRQVTGELGNQVTRKKDPATQLSSNLVTEVIVASNDRDLMQLIGPRVRFYLPAVGSKQKAKLYTENDFCLLPTAGR